MAQLLLSLHRNVIQMCPDKLLCPLSYGVLLTLHPPFYISRGVARGGLKGLDEPPFKTRNFKYS